MSLPGRNFDPDARLRTFDRLLRNLTAHFVRYGSKGKAAPTTRSMDFAFETDEDFSDAMAATLMIKSRSNEGLRRGLDAWNVFATESWIKSFNRHKDRSPREIRETLRQNPYEKSET